jgi:hypothetical protein
MLGLRSNDDDCAPRDEAAEHWPREEVDSFAEL